MVILKKILNLLDSKLLVCAVISINAAIGLCVYINPNFFGSFVYACGLFALFVAVIHLRWNLVFQLRIILLVSIGYYVGLIKVIDPNAFYSPIGFDAQTFEVSARMFALTSIAMLGALLGLKLFNLQKFKKNGYCPLAYRYTPIHSIPLIYVIGVLFVGYLSARSYGDSVFVSGYASGSGEGQLLGNLQAIGVVFLVMCFISLPQWGFKFMTLKLALVFYLLGWGILIRGGRIEVVAGILALLVAVPCARGEVFQLRKLHFFAMILFAAFLEAWGSLRSTLSDLGNTSDTVIEGYKNLLDAGIYHAGTVSGIATTFSNIVHMIDNNVIDFYYGLSYLEYIPRTPPAFIYPDRPADLAWMFQDYGYDAMGGFFELGEAYLNFGLIGCFIIPLIVSAFIAKTYKEALRGRAFWFFIFVALLAVYFRGAWYQTFAFYKTIFTGVTIYILVVMLGAVLTRPKRCEVSLVNPDPNLRLR
jgi:hypothetical protein